MEVLFGLYIVISIAMTVLYLEEEKYNNYYPSFRETVKFLLTWPYQVYCNLSNKSKR